MNHRFFPFSALAVSLMAAGFTQTTQTLSFRVDGATRSTVVHVPEDIDKPPVVFFVHGANGSGQNFQNEIRADAVADREKFIAVYPSASSDGAPGVWDDMRGTGNFPFFLAILDTLDARYEIDRNRVYMTGFSQGGFISFAAGCFYSDVFAAVAPVSGHAMTDCDIERPVPVFMTWGAQEGSSAFFPDRDAWLELDSCPGTPEITSPYPPSNPQSRATRVAYGPCAGGSYVIVDTIAGQGHQWPSATTLNQAQEVWDFFSQFSLDSDTAEEVGQRVPFTAPGRLSARYASGMVRLQGAGDKAGVRVMDIRGRLVSQTRVDRGRFPFKGKPGGLYVVVIDETVKTTALRIIVP